MLETAAPVLSVIIPCFNERARLRRTIDEVSAWAHERGRVIEIIVSDDGSTDGTPELARQWIPDVPGLRVVGLSRHQGKGAAVRAGLLAGRADRRMFIDADGAAPFSEIDALERALADGVDVAVGSRVLDTSRVDALYHRRFLGFFFRTIVRALMVRTIDDTQCGFKLFRGSAIVPLFTEQVVPGFAFDVEVLGRAERAGLRVIEVPIRWREQRGSKVHVIRDGLKMVLEVLRLRLALGPPR